MEFVATTAVCGSKVATNNGHMIQPINLSGIPLPSPTGPPQTRARIEIGAKDDPEPCPMVTW